MTDIDSDNDLISSRSNNNDVAIDKDDEYIIGDCLLCTVRCKVDDSESTALIGGDSFYCAMCHSRENVVFGLGLRDIDRSCNGEDNTFDAISVESSGIRSSSDSSSSKTSSNDINKLKDFRRPVRHSISDISVNTT